MYNQHVLIQPSEKIVKGESNNFVNKDEKKVESKETKQNEKHKYIMKISQHHCTWASDFCRVTDNISVFRSSEF